MVSRYSSSKNWSVGPQVMLGVCVCIYIYIYMAYIYIYIYMYIIYIYIYIYIYFLFIELGVIVCCIITIGTQVTVVGTIESLGGLRLLSQKNA